MTVYADTPRFADRKFHPRSLVLILGGHALLIAGVMSVKMDLPRRIADGLTRVELIPLPADPPPPAPPQPMPRSDPQPSVIDRAPVITPIPLHDPAGADPAPFPIPLDPGPTVGSGDHPTIQPKPLPVIDPVRVGPRLATPQSRLKPPFPQAKLEREEEAVLRLRLSIDPRGRVVAVDPIGTADRAFLDSARRHLIAHWRYAPATEDGRPVASTVDIILRFELNG